VFKAIKHLGHSTRWEISGNGEWRQVCSCGTVLLAWPGHNELSKR
jgi:hypothetical protein